MDNADGQFVLTREEAEKIVQASSGLYTVRETTVTAGANATGTIVAANPRRISLGFQAKAGTVLASTSMPVLAAPLGMSALAGSLFFFRYFQDGILCAYPWYFVNTGTATTIWVVEVLVI